MNKYKVGDILNVYGTVATNERGDNTATINWCRGTKVRVDYISFENELGVVGIAEPHKVVSSRSLVGKHFVVHPKQCRRVVRRKK